MNQLENKYASEIETILAKYPADRKRSAVMPLLFLAQREEGYISERSIDEIAEITGVSSTDVNSVVGFYTLFHPTREGRYRIQVCTDLPCALRGAEGFMLDLCSFLGVKPGETTTDGLFTVEEVKCLAACHRAPMFQLQGDGEIAYHENQTLQDAIALVQAIRLKHHAIPNQRAEAAHD